MYDYYFTFRSVTAAQQAASELNKSGLFGSVLRTPGALSSMGCGFAVRVPFHHGTAAAFLLRKKDISFMKIFHKDLSGAWTEVYL